MPNIVQLIKDDHKRVQDMFKAFESAEDALAKKTIVDGLIAELEIHASLEEEVLYPAVRRMADMKEHIEEANQEHHVVKLLVGELWDMRSSDREWEAKCTVLMENVRHHIQEEEQTILPKVTEDGTSNMADRLGERWVEAKRRITEQPGSMAVSGRRHS